MAFNKKGRFYEKGKCLSEELKGQIVDKILETGGDRFSGYFPGCFQHVYSARLMILACLGFRDNNLAELRQQLAVFFAFFP